MLCCGVSALLYEAIKGGSAGVCFDWLSVLYYYPSGKKCTEKVPVHVAINQLIYHLSHALTHSLRLGQVLKPNTALKFDLCCMHLLIDCPSCNQSCSTHVTQ